MRLIVKPVKGECSYAWRLQTNQVQPTWRGRVAHRLRLWALHLDPGHQLHLRITAEPMLSMAQERECIMAGLAAIERALNDTARDEASEVVLRQALPELYRAQP
jgi:hypothetical protein